MVVLGVWITSALYSIPKFIFSRTVTNVHPDGMQEVICIMHRGLFNSKLLDSINFAALYLVPLLVMTVSVSLFLSPTPPLYRHERGSLSLIRCRSIDICLWYGCIIKSDITQNERAIVVFQLFVNDIRQSV